ncbi:activating signal cointegrator 1 complex subunit 2 homolog [Venturia canescens]|uniref:activating signal cointegrator 1 complex subunit 2 homolog n=1 Tax=Venturia canescens TaxID=32260 RepID=UPI001C9CC3BD|nr:activating signal cointegrator 1 complex subunit 2 homolog [Venturia canescens]
MDLSMNRTQCRIQEIQQQQRELQNELVGLQHMCPPIPRTQTVHQSLPQERWAQQPPQHQQWQQQQQHYQVHRMPQEYSQERLIPQQLPPNNNAAWIRQQAVPQVPLPMEDRVPYRPSVSYQPISRCSCPSPTAYQDLWASYQQLEQKADELRTEKGRILGKLSAERKHGAAMKKKGYGDAANREII